MMLVIQVDKVAGVGIAGVRARRERRVATEVNMAVVAELLMVNVRCGKMMSLKMLKLARIRVVVLWDIGIRRTRCRASYDDVLYAENP